jgi:simple sugar transport system ATP-binding protein
MMPASTGPEVLRAEHIEKSFGRITALRDVNLRLHRGEVLGLLGDNGAGKSTLMKIFTGYYQPSAGQLYFEGEPIQFRSVGHARSLGIEAVYQDLALVDQLNVYRNMFLQRELVRGGALGILDEGRMRRRAIEMLERMKVRVPSVDVDVAKLSGGQRQAVSIARSVYQKAKLLLLDEPTAAMGAKESALILDLIQRLKEGGDIAMIIIAHNYAQIFDVCDRINLVEAGVIAFDKPTPETSVQELTERVVHRYRSAREDVRLHEGSTRIEE